MPDDHEDKKTFSLVAHGLSLHQMARTPLHPEGEKVNIRETHRIMHPDCPYCTPSESTGATQMALDLIAAERLRQVTQEGWTARHDSTHADDDLARAAACYALPPGYRGAIPNQWPWATEWWKPSKDRIRELVKAGALIAAEIDRRLEYISETPREIS